MKTGTLPCWLIDIDGTLADCEHRLHHIKKEPKDWRAFFAEVINDRPIPHMIDLVRHLYDAADVGGAKIIFISGRSDECREDTGKWLFEQFGPVELQNLYMRPAGDYRDDAVIKLELLEQIRLDGFDPIMAFDDRDRVVAAWRAAGIPCAQVAPGDF